MDNELVAKSTIIETILSDKFKEILLKLKEENAEALMKLSKEQNFAEILSQLKKEFAEIMMKVVELEGRYPMVFKAIVDKSGKITIPFAEREVERLGPNTIVQVKLKVVGRPSKDSGKRSGVGIG